MYFSSNQMDLLATILENKSGDVRRPNEASEERIVTALESLGNTSPVTGMGYAERVLNAVDNIDFNEGGSIPYVDGNKYHTILDYFLGTFNGPYEISPDVDSWLSMFASFSEFNQPVTIPSNVRYLSGAFQYSGFNQPITIPSNVVSVDDMFGYSEVFNSPVTISDGVTNCARLFCNAYAYNIPINIPDSVLSCYGMFHNASVFNQDVIFPINCSNVSNAFDGASVFAGNAYILNISANVDDMFRNCDNSLLKTVYLRNDSIININRFIRTGYTSMQFETIDNGYYNAAYNLKILYNMPEELITNSGGGGNEM